jgi:hypothetical protein
LPVTLATTSSSDSRPPPPLPVDISARRAALTAPLIGDDYPSP